MTSDRTRTRLVTVSAAYGAGGSVVAPALARRLGVPFLQRATTSAGGSNTDEPCAEALGPGETEFMPASRLLTSLTAAVSFGTTQSPMPGHHYDDELRRHCETGIRRLAGEDAGVILGRGAAVALGRDCGFHVRLYGPAELRVTQGAAIEGIGAEEARRHLLAADRARDTYVRRLYRADAGDPRHYHLMIDSTALPLEAVTEVILRALESFGRASEDARPAEPAPPRGPSPASNGARVRDRTRTRGGPGITRRGGNRPSARPASGRPRCPRSARGPG